MFFSKISTSAALVLALALHVSAHAAVAPVLGVSGTPVRSDVKRPNAFAPCGARVDIAGTINSSTAVAADASGSFSATVTNFNRRLDGSRQMTAKVDPTGKGTNFVAMTVTTNGDAAPRTLGSQPIVASLPAGMKCTGGQAGNKCLVQFVSLSGFGNCMVVSQDAAAASKDASASSEVSPAASETATAASEAAPAASDDTPAASASGSVKREMVEGTRAARRLLAELEDHAEDSEEAVAVIKRGIASWIWA